MSDETSRAFAELDDRAAAAIGAGTPHLPDRISMRDYVLDTEIGAFQLERGQTQRVKFDVVVEVQTIAGALGDDVDQVLSYDTISDAIHAALADTRLNLLETLAERVAELILADPRAARVFLKIEKLDRGPYKLGVEIMRSAETLAATGMDVALPASQIVVIGADMIGADHLGAWLDHLASATPAPVILVAPEGRAKGAGMPAAVQTRLDLLRLDQAAWDLAGRDPRIMVADSRTEIDWALRNGKLTVWAPTRLVLDTPDAGVDTSAAGALAAWVARTLGASHITALGNVGAVTTDLPLTQRAADQAPAL